MPEPEKPKSRSFASAAKLGAKVARLAAKLKAAEDARKAAETERDALKAKPAPEDVVKERDALKGQIRAGKHKSAFEAAAKLAKVRPDALEDLWELSKLDTSADEPDAKAIESAIGEKVKARPYLLDAGDGQVVAPKAPLNPGPGSERGGKVQSGGFTVKRSQLSDPSWMRENQSKIGEASSQGNLSIVD